MTLKEKIKYINQGMRLQQYVEKCQNLTDAPVGEGTSTYCGNCDYYDAFKDMLAEEKRIYAGTADYVEFFETVISTLGLDKYIDYEVEDVDGELEILITSGEEV